MLYEILASHPDLAWFSDVTNRWPTAPQLAVLSRVSRPPWTSRAPRPVEGYRIWDHYTEGISDLNARLGEDDARSVHPERMSSVIMAHCRFQGRSRFVNKNTRNTRRVLFLDRLFEDPIFVHVIRDPRASVASLLRVRFWPTLPIWTHDGITPSQWKAQGGSETELAASLWAAEVSAAREDAKRLRRPESYLEVHYEDVIASSGSALTRVLEHASLDPAPVVTETLPLFDVNERSLRRFERDLTEEQLEEIAAVVDQVPPPRV